MVLFYNALGACLEAKQVKVGSASYRGAIGDLEIVLYGIPKKQPPTTPNLSLRFEVKDIDKVMTGLREIPETRIIMDVEMLPDGKKAIVLDPDGHSVELVQSWAQDADSEQG